MIIKITKQALTKCQTFAQSIGTDFYSSRGQFNAEKRAKDQVIGKIAELVVCSHLSERGVKVGEPDFTIYSKSRKSWDYDLKSPEFNFHIKGQDVEQSKKYGASWIFENNDRHVFEKYQPNDYVCFVTVDLAKMEADIKHIVAVTDLHQLQLFKRPRLAHLTTKSAVYCDDLKSPKFTNPLKFKE